MRFFSSFVVIVVSTFLLSSCNLIGGRRHSPTGIALGGGGAKAAAEIGALEELELLDVKIDYIAGTSMGAVVGGALCCWLFC